MPYIKERYNKPGNVFLHPAHRLDRPVSGCFMLARTSKSASRMTEAFRLGRVTKHYLAISDQRSSGESGKLEDYLLKDHRANKVKVVGQGREKAKKAILHYSRIASSQGYCLYHVVPETGRSHQIRVQLSHKGIPIVGDIKYGGIQIKDQRAIGLHCLAMTFEHPTKRVRMTVRAVPGHLDIWRLFSRDIEEISFSE